MARTVRDLNLETRTARGRLKVAHKPYFRLIEPGLHLGYRKLASGPGTWLVRRYVGGGKYAVKNLATDSGVMIVADDYADADNSLVLTFAQAQQRARKQRRHALSAGPYTVADAMRDYFALLAAEGRSWHSLRDSEYRANAFILHDLGRVELARLTTDQLRRWRDGLVTAPPRLRTKPGKTQKHKKVEGDDWQRARRASTNRVWTILRAALNYAFHEGKAADDLAWRKIKPFRQVNAARKTYLTIAEAKRLIEASDDNFRPLVKAALLTGARYSELARLKVANFHSDSGTVYIERSKSGQARDVVLTDEGIAFFKQITKKRDAASLMFYTSSGEAWGISHQARPMADAVKRAKFKTKISFHGLRHTWASHAVMNGVPLMVVARNLGHSDTRMVERHYGHLSGGFVADAIRAGAPRFGTGEGV